MEKRDKNFLIGLTSALIASIFVLIGLNRKGRCTNVQTGESAVIKYNDKSNKNVILQIGGSEINDEKYFDRSLYVYDAENDVWHQRR